MRLRSILCILGRRVQNIIGLQGQKLSGILNQWTLRIPPVLEQFSARENLFLMEAAPGVTLKNYLRDPEVSLEEKTAIVEALTRFSLEMLFKHGYFDPDRHSGNWLIDLKVARYLTSTPGS